MTSTYPFETNIFIANCCKLKKCYIEACMNVYPNLLHSVIIPNEQESKHTLAEKITPVIACIETAITIESSLSEDGSNKTYRRLESCLNYLQSVGADMTIPRILYNMCSSMLPIKCWKKYVKEDKN